MLMRHLAVGAIFALLASACETTPLPHASPDGPAADVGPRSSAAHPHAADINVVRLLPAPYADGSPEAREELDRMLAMQATRSGAAAELARADAEPTVFRLLAALGANRPLTPQLLPALARLSDAVLDDEGLAIGRPKDHFARTRPCRAEPRLEPVLDCPRSGSYPSGHAAFGWAIGLVLADMLPERREQILTRAQQYAWNRVVAGVHYPSDVEAGRIAGTVIAAFLLADPTFRAQELAARHELRAALGLAESGPEG